MYQQPAHQSRCLSVVRRATEDPASTAPTTRSCEQEQSTDIQQNTWQSVLVVSQLGASKESFKLSPNSTVILTNFVDAMAEQKRPRLEAGAAAAKEPDFANLSYMSGHNNHFATEALKGALPVGQNSPQKCNYGLYAEQINGTAFTAPRSQNRRSWFYRILPSVAHEPFQPVAANPFENRFDEMEVDPSQMRWNPMPWPKTKKNFVEGIATTCGVGSPGAKSGLAIYLYACNADMGDTGFYNSDGEMLVVPQQGALKVRTEMGLILVEVNEILVIPRGVKFSVDLELKEFEEGARGYILETFEGHFILPDLGPIGSNCLANPRDFETPVAWYEDREVEYTLLNKFGGKLFSAALYVH